MKDKQPQANILIVDDTLANLRLLTKMLTERGYKIRGVSNGSAALKAARLSPPDLILLDIMMPEMNGFEVCEQLKADERTQDIPVIFISALNEIFDKVTAFSTGGVDYITKPFQIEEVLARVNTHLTLRNLQKNLQANLLELQARNEELDAFAHTVSHNLQNSLSLIIGFAEWLEDESTTRPAEELQEYAHTIARNGRKMSNVLDALLLLAGVRKLEVVPQPLDMAGIVAEAQQRLADMVAEYRPEIILPATWPAALGYAPWVEEVWLNYLSNAMKYSRPSPHLTLGATVQGDGQVRFWVQDNGSGLTPEEQASVFTEFTRLKQVQVKGHGLGLSIVQRIVTKLGGQVGVESQAGQGSTFYFTLPEASHNHL